VEYKTCSFTGHRPQKLPWRYNESCSDCVRLKEVLTIQISRLAALGVTDYFCGMAEGTDMFCSEIVLAQHKKNPALRLHCILPHKGQADKWSHLAQERYRSILEQANSVEYVSHDYYDGCMIDRNHRLVESAGLLLAVYNGVRRSGTGATVNYARKLGRKIILIDPITSNVICEEANTDL